MNKDEFIQTCSDCGYCSKVVARKYAKDRDEFTEEDFEEVFRVAQRMEAAKKDLGGKFTDYDGTRSTKRLIGGTREKNPFMHNYD